jgi:hypothetical protein
MKFQYRVAQWVTACFGPVISADVTERNHRFLEEALELVQSTGCTTSEAHQLVDYFDRPIGEPAQELGGTTVTLVALATASGLNMDTASEAELERNWQIIEKDPREVGVETKVFPAPAIGSPMAAIHSEWSELDSIGASA